MKKETVTTIAIFAILLAVITIPLTIPVFAGTSAYFNISLTLANSAPSIAYVDTISNTPTEGSTKVVSFYFNATDANGVADIPASNAIMKINKSGTTLTSSACTVVATVGTLNRYECNITINYFNLPGIWTINATVYDGASVYATNTTELYTNGNVYGISLKTASLTFSGSPGQNNLEASNSPQIVNNTGNNAITYLNVTAYTLVNGLSTIGAGNLTLNISNSTAGQILGNNSAVAINNSNISVLGTTNMFIYLDVPAGSNGTYLSSDSWVVTMNS